MYGHHRDSGPVPVIRKRLSFLSITILCLTAILVTGMVGAFGIAAYGMRIIDGKTDSLTGMVTEAVRALPEVRKALPPALADALDDERRPDYLANLETSARIIEKNARGYNRAVVEITNNGDEVVSLLSLRVVGLNDSGDPIVEESTMGATPIQIDDEWRGPLMPQATRRIPVCFWEKESLSRVDFEITDVRVWTPSGGEQIDPIAVTASTSGPNEAAP